MKNEASIRVAIINNSDFANEPTGGADSYVKGLSLAMERLGVDVWRVGIVTPPREKGEREIALARRPISNYSMLIRLLRISRKLRSDQTWNIHVNRPEQLVPFMFRGRKGRTFVVTVHGPVFEAMRKLRSGPISRIYSVLEKKGLRMADAVIFVSRATRDAYIGRYPWLESKAHVIPTGVDPTFFEEGIDETEAKKAFGFGADKRLISFVGRLKPEKNVDLIIRSFARIARDRSELRLLIAGEGDLLNDLGALARDSGVSDRVTFLGKVPHQKIRSLLAASELLVLASKWEGSPTVIREALSMRTKVVATDVGDVSELIKDPSLGVIAREPTEQALADGMLSALRTGRPKETSRFVKDFSWSVIGERIISVYGK